MLATLSQIRAWSTEHLIDAAGYWTETADRWEDVFLQMRNQAHAIAWNGAGGDGLRQRTRADFSTVSGIADQLRRAATIARNGAGTIDAAQRRVMYAVEDAQDAGFNVGEDLSVTDTKTTQPAAVQAARLAQAQALAGDIRLRVGQLVAAENEVSGQLAATTGDVGNVRFAGAPVVAHSAVQLVDFFKQDGPTPPPPGAPHPSGGADGPYSDPITSMMLPPAGTEAPVSDATKRWVDNMVNELAARPPDDPIAVEARRLAFQALHRPCNSAEWTAGCCGFRRIIGWRSWDRPSNSGRPCRLGTTWRRLTGGWRIGSGGGQLCHQVARLPLSSSALPSWLSASSAVSQAPCGLGQRDGSGAGAISPLWVSPGFCWPSVQSPMP